MEGYGYPYGPGYQGMVPSEPQYLDHGDGYPEYYGMSPMAESTAARYAQLFVVQVRKLRLMYCKA